MDALQRSGVGNLLENTFLPVFILLPLGISELLISGSIKVEVCLVKFFEYLIG